MNDANQIPMQEFLNLGKSFVLPVGTRLQIEIGGIDMKLASISVGLLPDDCIIIKYPNPGNLGSISHKLFKGNKVSVRYVFNGNIFGFESELLGTTSDPFKLIFIAYPTLIVRHQLRKNRRVLGYLPAELFPKNKNDANIIPDVGHIGIISDISIEGCSFDMLKTAANQTLPNIKINEAVVVQIQLPGVETRVEISGEVKRSVRDAHKLNVGIQFNETSEDIKARIYDYILAIEKFTTSE